MKHKNLEKIIEELEMALKNRSKYIESDISIRDINIEIQANDSTMIKVRGETLETLFAESVEFDFTFIVRNISLTCEALRFMCAERLNRT